VFLLPAYRRINDSAICRCRTWSWRWTVSVEPSRKRDKWRRYSSANASLYRLNLRTSEHCWTRSVRYAVCSVSLTHSVSKHGWFRGLVSVRITWKPEYVGPRHLFSLPRRANVVAEYLGTEGPHTYFSVIRLMGLVPHLT